MAEFRTRAPTAEEMMATDRPRTAEQVAAARRGLAVPGLGSDQATCLVKVRALITRTLNEYTPIMDDLQDLYEAAEIPEEAQEQLVEDIALRLLPSFSAPEYHERANQARKRAAHFAMRGILREAAMRATADRPVGRGELLRRRGLKAEGPLAAYRHTVGSVAMDWLETIDEILPVFRACYDMSDERKRAADAIQRDVDRQLAESTLGERQAKRLSLRAQAEIAELIGPRSQAVRKQIAVALDELAKARGACARVVEIHDHEPDPGDTEYGFPLLHDAREMLTEVWKRITHVIEGPRIRESTEAPMAGGNYLVVLLSSRGDYVGSEKLLDKPSNDELVRYQQRVPGGEVLHGSWIQMEKLLEQMRESGEDKLRIRAAAMALSEHFGGSILSEAQATEQALSRWQQRYASGPIASVPRERWEEAIGRSGPRKYPPSSLEDVRRREQEEKLFLKEEERRARLRELEGG